MPFGSVNGIYTSAGVGDVHNPVDNDWSGLIADTVDDAVLEKPSWSQRFHVASIDLIRRRKSSPRKIKIVEPPVKCSRRGRLLRGRSENGGKDQNTAEKGMKYAPSSSRVRFHRGDFVTALHRCHGRSILHERSRELRFLAGV